MLSSVLCFTVIVAGSNAGVLGRSGSGGLGGGGGGSSFFLGAIARCSQETKGGELTQQRDPASADGGGPLEARSLYPQATGVVSSPSIPQRTANNRGRTIKGYAFVLLFKTKVIVHVIRIWMMENYISWAWNHLLIRLFPSRQRRPWVTFLILDCWPCSVKSRDY